MLVESRKIYFYLCVLLIVDFLILLWVGKNLSISYDEASHFFEPLDFGGFLSNLSVFLFGQNDIGLRILFLLLHLCNAVLMFIFAKGFLKRPSDALFCVLLFLLLPGVNAAAILISNSGIIIFLTLLLCILYQQTHKIPYWLLLIMAFVDKSFALVFLALIFYGSAQKNTVLVFLSLIFFALNMYLFDLEIGGHPAGYFIDTSGHLLLIFSPLVFLYFLYALYRFYNSKTKPLIWYISIVVLGFILFLSLRQKVETETFAPLLIVGIPLMVSLYFSWLRVRLSEFKSRYKIPFGITLLVLLAMVLVLLFSKPLFALFSSNQEEYFAYRHYLAKELAQNLKEQNIFQVNTNERMQKRLRFYGINQGGNVKITTHFVKNAKEIPIFYYGKKVAVFYVQKSL